MRFFKEMVKVVRTKGVYTKVDPEKVFSSLFWEVVVQNEVFVFSPSEEASTQELVPILDQNKIVDTDNYFPPSLDAPFKVFSIEIADGAVVENFYNGWKIHCLMVVESLEDENLECCFALLGVPGADGGPAEREVFPVALKKYPDMRNIIRSFLDRLQVEKDGLEETEEVVFLAPKDGAGKKRPHTIRRVFHITPKNRTKTYAAHSRRNIQWTHRWSVRGTWVHFWKDEARTVPDMTRIGKDRNGDYCVPGKTWRVAHVKGPENTELVKKVRMVA